MRSIEITSDGLLDHADQLGVAPLVGADPAARPVGEVEADLAEADPLLDLADRLGERERVLLAGAQQVEREPLGGAAADPRQLRQLGDQPLNRRRVARASSIRAVARSPGAQTAEATQARRARR